MVTDVAALKSRIQQAQEQLSDWASCVSAKTPKGQAEIQKFSGEISADKSKIAHAQQSQSNSDSRRGVAVDVWA
jgi:DNA anti-recombination protein RmuC